jgi:hypothetical protein
MPTRFTGIRLLLLFVGINFIMILMLVTSMTSAHPWLAKVLPGHFETGVDSSGYWVFFALVLLVDAVTVFVAGLMLMLPALRDGASTNERRLTSHLVDRGGVSEDAKEAIFVALREDAVTAYYQLMVGRWILLVGAAILVLAFYAVSLTFARALPDGEMFLNNGFVSIEMPDKGAGLEVTKDGVVPVKNAAVRGRKIAEFTADQVAAAVVLNAPEIYGVRFTSLTNNPAYPLFTHFIFAFRTILGFTLVLTIISFLRRVKRPKREKKTIESVEAKLEEKKA